VYKIKNPFKKLKNQSRIRTNQNPTMKNSPSMKIQILPKFDGNIEEYGPICQVFPNDFEEGSFSGELSNLVKKIAFFNATSSPQKKSTLRGNFLRLRPREGVALGPAESAIRPADQTGKLSAGLVGTSFSEEGLDKGSVHQPPSHPTDRPSNQPKFIILTTTIFFTIRKRTYES
jgi:hypothetical protein